MRATPWILSLALCGLAVTAHGGQPQSHTHQFRWVDASGLPHYSDSLSVKALKYGYDVLDASGRVIRHVPAELTASERKAAQARAAQASSSREAALDQQQRDRQMLMAYPTEAEFKASQQARIDSLEQHIHTTRMNLASQEQNLSQLLDSAADYGTRNKPVPHALTQRIATQRQAVDAQRQLLKKQQTRKTTLNKQVAAQLQHYRTLRAKQQARYGH